MSQPYENSRSRLRLVCEASSTRHLAHRSDGSNDQLLHQQPSQSKLILRGIRIPTVDADQTWPA